MWVSMLACWGSQRCCRSGKVVLPCRTWKKVCTVEAALLSQPGISGMVTSHLQSSSWHVVASVVGTGLEGDRAVPPVGC